MANEEHLAKLNQGPLAWNEWRSQNSHVRPDLRGADLAGRDLCGYNLSEVDFTVANLCDAQLGGAICNAIFIGAKLINVRMKRIRLMKSDLELADLSNAVIENSSFDRVQFVRANLKGSQIKKVIFESSDFSDAILGVDSDAEQTKLDSVTMKRARLVRSDFRRVLVNASTFERSDFTGADLEEAGFDRVEMIGVVFKESIMTSVNINKVTFKSFSSSKPTDFTEAKLNCATIEDSYFVDVVLHRTDLTNTRIGGVDFKNVNLRTAIGLDAVDRGRTSFFDEKTINSLNNNLHRNFKVLFYEYNYHRSPLVLPSKNRYLSCYIACDESNMVFVRQLNGRLLAEGIPSWCRFINLPAGKRIEEEVVKNIALYDKTVLVLSSESVNSEYFQKQICLGIQSQMLQNQYKLLPLMLNRYNDLQELYRVNVSHIVNYNLGEEVFSLSPLDFSGWEIPGLFDKTFDLMLSALQI